MSDTVLDKTNLPSYSGAEDAANCISHAVGATASLAALVLLIRAGASHGASALIGNSIFGLSLILLFSASALYHGTRGQEKRNRLHYLDHSSIYVLIAGTYTPYCLTVLKGPLGYGILAVIWALAAGGIVLKLLFLGKHRGLSTAAYVLMGWIIAFAFGYLKKAAPPLCLFYLVAGGLAYTLGSVFYAIKRVPWFHFVFHIFVIAGAACHVISVLNIY